MDALAFLRPVLIPLAAGYAGVMRARNRRYDRDPQRVHEAPVPVISVGNITVGGTGKTPLVIELVRRLAERGEHPAILTRGYAAAAGALADEVAEFRIAAPDVPVVVNPDRVAGARQAVAEEEATCLVLDDGFQHRRLARDLDIVVIDALSPWGGGWTLPAGRLREPLEGLRRADLFVLNRANQVSDAQRDAIEARLASIAPAAHVVAASVTPDALTFGDGTVASSAALHTRCVLAVCGLGNPRTFEHLIHPLVGRFCGLLRYGDHRRYSSRDVQAILRSAAKHEADLVLTTRKDWVKLVALWPAGAPVPLARLDVRLFFEDDEPIEAALSETLSA